jgi:hypothetical protein
MTKAYELPKGRRIIADFDENGIIKVTVQALDSLIEELNYYADKVCDIEQIRAEIEQKQYDFMSDGDYNEGIRFGLMLSYQIIDKYKGDKE